MSETELNIDKYINLFYEYFYNKNTTECFQTKNIDIDEVKEGKNLIINLNDENLINDLFNGHEITLDYEDNEKLIFNRNNVNNQQVKIIVKNYNEKIDMNGLIINRIL